MGKVGGIISGAAGLAGGLFGGLAQRSRLRKQREMVQKAQGENEDWYNRNYNEDMTQRADAQRVLSLTEQRIRERNRQAAGAAAVAGGSDEGVAAAKAAGNQAAADAASQVAASGGARKERVENQYIARKDALDEEARRLEGATPSALDIASGAIGGGANGLLKEWDL